MKRIWTVIGPAGAIGGGIVAIITFSLQNSMPPWVMFAWPVITIAWSVNVLIEQGTNRLNRKTIEWQATVIRNQAELLTRIYFEDIGGRE